MDSFCRIFGQKPPLVWPFPEPEKTPALTTSQVVSDREPVRLVIHEAEDGLWRFLTGGAHDVEDGRCATLREIVDIDLTVCEVADLPRGWRAEREAVGEPWTRFIEPKRQKPSLPTIRLHELPREQTLERRGRKPLR